jgi:uncharacterized protein YjbI with pentapeptide repeats
MCDDTCDYIARKSDPESWHGDDPGEWSLRRSTDGSGSGLAEWRCPHPSLEGEAYCVFHTEPSSLPPGVDEGEALLEALDDAGQGPFDDGPEHRGQFVGATFGAVDLSGETIAATDHDVRFDHAVFHADGANLCFADTTVTTRGSSPVSFGRTVFRAVNGGDVEFTGAAFGTDDCGDLYVTGAEFRTDGAGDLRFDETVFRAGDGVVNFSGAEFVTDDGEVRFTGAEFASAVGDVRFVQATFAAGGGPLRFDGAEFTVGDGELDFTEIAFSATGDGAVQFPNAEFVTDGQEVMYFAGAEFTAEDGDVRFDDAAFTAKASEITFRLARFATEGDGEVRFNDAEFRAAGPGNVLFRLVEFTTSGDGFVEFPEATFVADDGSVSFDSATFRATGDGDVFFRETEFETVGDGDVSFLDAEFVADGVGIVGFYGSEFRTAGSGTVGFENVTFAASNNQLDFPGATFTAGDGDVSFVGATFTAGDGDVRFDETEYAAGTEGRTEVTRTSADSTVSFEAVEFTANVQAVSVTVDPRVRLSFSESVFVEEWTFSPAGGLPTVRGILNFSGTEFRQPPQFEDSPVSADPGDAEPTAGETFRVVFADAVDFSNAALPDGTDFSGIRFPREAAFDGADLSGVNFSRADLSGVSLERARLNRAELLGTDLRGAHLYGALLGDARINRRTKFWPEVTISLRDLPAFGTVRTGGGVGYGSWRRLKTRLRQGRLPYCAEDPRYADLTLANLPPTNGTSLEKAAEVYATLEQVASDNSLPELASEAFLGRKDTQRNEYRRDGRFTMWVRSTVPNVVARYGESPWRVLGTGAVIVLLWGVLYWAFDLVERADSGGDPTLLETVYFSSLTFTTLGYGDFNPATSAGRYLAVSETTLGVVLLAILVFVFGRRATR